MVGNREKGKLYEWRKKCWGREIRGSDGRERWKWSGREEGEVMEGKEGIVEEEKGGEVMGGEEGSGGEGRGGEVMRGEEISDGERIGEEVVGEEEGSGGER